MSTSSWLNTVPRCVITTDLTKTKTIAATAELSARIQTPIMKKKCMLLTFFGSSSPQVGCSSPRLDSAVGGAGLGGRQKGEAAGRRGKQIWTTREDPINEERDGARVSGRRGGGAGW